MFKQAIISGVITASVILPGQAQAALIQFGSGNGSNGHWYGYIAGDFSWTAAFEDAATQGGYLLTITSQAEQDFISANFNPGTSMQSAGWGWIGASDEGDEGNFTWRNGPEQGTSISFDNWAMVPVPEPNNGADAGIAENYAHIDNRPDRPFGTWNDASHDNRKGYYIEFSADPNAVPEPLTLLATATALGGGLTLRKRYLCFQNRNDCP